MGRSSDVASSTTRPARPPSSSIQRDELNSIIFDDVEEEGPPLYEESLGNSSLSAEDSSEVVDTRLPNEQRFARWGNWVEKRALERLNDPEREARRAARRKPQDEPRPPSYVPRGEDVINQTPAAPQQTPPLYPSAQAETAEQPLPPIQWEPARQMSLLHGDLWREDFGSRFISHSNERITCALPLFNGRLIIVGTVTGLKVLNSNDSPARNIWTGFPVWDMQVLKAFVHGDRTPRGSVLVLCGGQEDPKTPGRPLAKGGQVEARVWKFGSLASLARWSASLFASWEGLNLGKKKGKEREKIVLAPAPGGHAHPTMRSHGSIEPPSESELEFANAWATEYISLRPTASGKPADIVAIDAKVHDPEIFVALATPNSVILHTGLSTETGFSFRPSRQFYLPFAPANIGLVRLVQGRAQAEGASILKDLPGANTSPSDGVLGVYVSFGDKACVIRTSDSSVIDFKPPGDRGRAKGVWAAMQTVQIGGEEMYLFTRGSETMLYSAPLRLPISVPPIVNTVWPGDPTSILAVSNTTEVLLLTTNASSELRTQYAIPARGGPLGLLEQMNTIIGRARVLPIAWSHDPSIYCLIESKKDWRIIKLWRG